MRYRGEANVDESCIPWTEVVLWTVNGSSLTCYPSPPSKSQINFDEAQRLARKEIKCLYGLINREAEMFTPGGPVSNSFQHTL